MKKYNERQSVKYSVFYDYIMRRAAMTKEELVMYKICSLFAGVGGIDLGFLQTNNCEIAYANEFDKYSKQIIQLFHRRVHHV